MSETTERPATAPTATKKTTARKTTARKASAAKAGAPKATARKATTRPRAAAKKPATKPATTKPAAPKAEPMDEGWVAKVESAYEELRSRVEAQVVLVSKTIENAVNAYVHGVTEVTDEGRKAVEEVVTPLFRTIKDRAEDGRKAADEAVGMYRTGMTEIVDEGVKTIEGAFDTTIGIMTTTVTSVTDVVKPAATELRGRADKAVKDFREVVGL